MKNNNNQIIYDILQSSKSYGSIDEILKWIKHKNESLKVNIERHSINNQKQWFIDDNGVIRNQNNSFFSILGIHYHNEGKTIEHPIIIQDEIGYLGIICKHIDGILHFLMQAKIEPGNLNKIQISPTIQATKSNFTQKHGGKRPLYYEYFANAKEHQIIVDQLQSEQSSRFLGKRNRNIIIYVEKEVEVYENHMWMTMYQIKQLMKHDNLVNMDTRTVLSCIPYYSYDENYLNVKDMFSDQSMYQSMFQGNDVNLIPQIYHSINNYKMFNKQNYELVPITSLRNWTITDYEIRSNEEFDFKIIFCDISIEKREVVHWFQPLLAANGKALFGLYTSVIDGIRKFLVHIKPEIGSFDSIEIGPTVQLESSAINSSNNSIDQTFIIQWNAQKNVLHDVLLSEEGGRFYHEENFNVILDIDANSLEIDDDKYFWVSYQTLNQLIQVNNCVNIQLRNLLSLLEI